MDFINLHIFIVADDEDLENELKNVSAVKDVNLSFTTVKDVADIGDLEYKYDEIVISEDINAVKPYFNVEGVSVIYIGKADDFGTDDIPENLLDVWGKTDSGKFRLSRFHKIISDAITAYRAWLYENYLMATIDSMLDLVWYKDAEGLHWLVNNKFERTVHKTREQIHGMGHNYIWDVPPEDGGKSEFRCLESEREVMARQTTVQADEQVKTENGALRHFLTYKSPLYDRAGRVMGTVGIGHDVTDMNNASLELKILLENLPMATIVCDNNWKPLQLNPMFTEKFGISGADIGGLDYKDWKGTAFELLEDNGYNDELHCFISELTQGINNDKRYYHLTEQAILDYYGEITGYYCFYRDITEACEYERMILERANTDELTKLYNRRFFFDELIKRREEEITVLFMDMDNFKKVNDTYGHNVGDDVLINTANQITNFFRDGVVARLGGDEFAVALFGAQDDEVLKDMADRLTKAIEVEHAPLKVGLSVSIGIVHTSGSLEDIDAFMNESDQKMYEQKLEKKKALGQTGR